MVKPRKCPSCKKLLYNILSERHGDMYVWNADECNYENDDATVQLMFCCGGCGSRIGSWRADGFSEGVVPQVGA